MSGITKHMLLDIAAAFTGERVLLRGWQDADTDALFVAIRESAARLEAWMPWPQWHRTPRDTREYVRRTQAQWIMRESFDLGVFARDTGHLLGAIGLHPRDWNVPAFEIGYWLRTSAEGCGYISEAVRLLTAYSFDALAAQRVMIRCDARNARSAAVPQRLGFACEGTLRRDTTGTDGTPRDTLIWAMIPDDYHAARTRW